MPGGVNSPVRACKAVGTVPLFIDHAKGSKIWDEDGNEFELELVDTLEHKGVTYYAMFPAVDADACDKCCKGRLRQGAYVRCLPQGRDNLG